VTALTQTTGVQALPEGQREQYHQINDEIARMTARQAVDHLDGILGHIPDDDEHTLLRAGLIAERADLLLEMGHLSDAWDAVQASLEAGWTNPDTYSLAGWIAYTDDRPGRAREQFDRALDADEDLVSALMGRGLALMEDDELELARSDFSHAIRLDPENPELYSLRGEVYLGLRDLEQAERDVRKARELDAEDPEYGIALGRMLMVRGETEEALEVIDDLLDEEDPELEPLLMRSHLRLIGGDSEQARRDAIRASNHYPDEAFAFVQLAHSQLADGNLSLALKAAERAVRLDSSLPDGYMVRGTARQMQGQPEEAQEDLERAGQAPAELPMFLLGPFYDVLEAGGYHQSMRDLLRQYRQMYSGETGPGQMGGEFPGGMGGEMPDPEEMMGQIFDESGELDERLKPFLEMAVQNAPSILKNLPPGLLKGMGGLDPDRLDEMDLSNLSSDEIESQMKQIYQMFQSGENPFEQFDTGDAGGPEGPEGTDGSTDTSDDDE